MDNSYKIYKYTNILNNKVYIGRTKNSLSQRAGKNGKKYLLLKHFGAVIKQDGWENFVSEILEDGLTYEECCKKEREYIILYDSTNPAKGYNIAEGGEGPTKEALEQMSKSHTNNHLSEEHKLHISQGLGQGVNNVNYGRKHTQETCKHISESKRGDKHPNWNKHLSDSTKNKIKEKASKPCLQFTLDGEFIQEWPSAKEAAKILDLNYKGINNCLRGLRHTSGGYIWKYKDEDMNAKYEDNKYILENFGIRSFVRKEEILQNKNNQEEPSTTIPEMGVEQ